MSLSLFLSLLFCIFGYLFPRSSSARSNEPGDAIRVVNAVLTSLDALRRRYFFQISYFVATTFFSLTFLRLFLSFAPIFYFFLYFRPNVLVLCTSNMVDSIDPVRLKTS